MLLLVIFGSYGSSKSSSKSKIKTRSSKPKIKKIPISQLLRRISQLESKTTQLEFLLSNFTKQQKPENPCRYNKCKNRSACIVSDNYRSRRCECSPGFIGVSCEKKLPSGAYCKQIVMPDQLHKFGFSDGYTIDWECTCPTGFSGKYCEIEGIKSPCEDNVCVNQNKTCWVDHKNHLKYQCLDSCPLGRNGTNCENCADGFLDNSQGECVKNPCLDVKCRNFSTCQVNSNFDFECKCLAGYSGELCEKTPCDRKNCGDEGSFSGCKVVEVSDKFIPECVCNKGYEIIEGVCKKTTCFDETCNNHGVCTEYQTENQNSTEKFKSCLCEKPYSGTLCEKCASGFIRDQITSDCIDSRNHQKIISYNPKAYEISKHGKFIRKNEDKDLIGNATVYTDSIPSEPGVYRWDLIIHSSTKFQMSFGISSYAGEVFLPGVGKSYLWDLESGNKRLMDGGESDGWMDYTDHTEFEIGDEIGVELDTFNRELKYFVNNFDLGIAFENVTVSDWHLVIELENTNDKVEILL